MNELFDFLYQEAGLEKKTFGKHYCAEGPFVHGEEKLIARYAKEKGGDGHDVEVYETRLPARFFRIMAIETRNSVGGFKPGFNLETGSGQEQLAADIALAISEGMLELTESKS